MSLLTAYLIGGDTVGIDLLGWTATQLGGNPAFKSEATVGAGREDVSNIQNWCKWGIETTLTKAQILVEINALIADWGALAQADKDAALDFIKRYDLEYTTDQRLELSGLKTGHTVYDATEGVSCVWNGTGWHGVGQAPISAGTTEVTNDTDTLLATFVIPDGKLPLVSISIEEDVACTICHDHLVTVATNHAHWVLKKTITTDEYELRMKQNTGSTATFRWAVTKIIS